MPFSGQHAMVLSSFFSSPKKPKKTNKIFPAWGKTCIPLFPLGKIKYPFRKSWNISGKNKDKHFFRFKGENNIHKSISISISPLKGLLEPFRWGHGTLEVGSEIEVRSFQQKLRGVDTSRTREVGGGGCGIVRWRWYHFFSSGPKSSCNLSDSYIGEVLNEDVVDDEG